MALAGWRFGCVGGDFRGAPLFVVAPHTLVLAAKSSRKRAINCRMVGGSIGWSLPTVIPQSGRATATAI